MSDLATWGESEHALVEDVLESNLRHLGVLERSREKIMDAASNGELVSMPDGTLALSLAGGLLGARLTPNTMPRGFDEKADAAVVVFGLGAGHSVRELRARARGPVIVFDPDPSAIRATLQSGPSELGGVKLTCDFDELRMWWPSFSRGKSRATLVTTSGYAERYSEAYRTLNRELETLVSSAKVNENTLHIRARSWIGNTLENLPRLVGTRPIGLLRNSYKNVPAFIVGAGPCVGKNGHLLSEAVRKGIVFGVNSSASVLASNGAEPQVVVCLEAANNASQLASLPWISRVNRAMSLSASPATWALPEGHVLPFYEQISFFSKLRELLGVEPTLVAGSVSTAAFSLAEMMGCSPIVFVGQDLAFTDGLVHAAGTEIESSRVRVDRDAGRILYDWCDPARRLYKDLTAPTGEKLSEVTAWGGEGLVVSSATWNLVRQWLESRAQQLRSVGDERRLINATEGGSRIRGFAEMPLGDVLSGLDNLEVTSESMRQQAARAAPALSAEGLRAWLKDQSARASEVGAAASMLAEKVQDAIGTMNADEPKRIAAVYAHVSVAEHGLKKSVRAQPMLEAWCQADIDDLVLKRGTVGEADAQVDARTGLETELGVARVVGSAASDLRMKLSKLDEKL